MREEPASRDRRIAAIAARQHGVVSREQIFAAGIDKSAITRRLGAGRLHRLHRGVYAVGHVPLTDEGRWLAAVLACGEEAVLSHRSAAALWGITPHDPSFVEVTVPTRNGREPRPGIVLHRSATLIRADVTRRRRIPVTTHRRTLHDLGFGPEPTKSKLERMFVHLCHRHNLPRPLVNARVGPYEVDFLWPEAGLVVELDGYRYHSSRAAFEADRARDAQLVFRGFQVLRFTYRQIRDHGGSTASSLRSHLRRRAQAAREEK